MIPDVDRSLESWVDRVVPGVGVVWGRPGAVEGAVAWLQLLELGEPAGQGGGEVAVRLRYLVAVVAAEVAEEHRLLSELLFAALAEPAFEVRLGAVPLAVWAALGSPPRPGFLIETQLRKPRAERPVRLVTQPPRFETGGVASFAGQVLGPGDVALAGAEVALPRLGRAVRTDAAGRFLLRGVPPTAIQGRVRVRAKGQERWLDLAALDPAGPFLLRFDGLVPDPSQPAAPALQPNPRED